LPFFALKDFLSNRPLKSVWADPPTAVRFRVKVMQELIYYFKKKKKKRNESFLHQRRKKEIYKLPYIEDFEANVEVSEDKILYKLEHTM
jgi:hypothetical protein